MLTFRVQLVSQCLSAVTCLFRFSIFSILCIRSAVSVIVSIIPNSQAYSRTMNTILTRLSVLYSYQDSQAIVESVLPILFISVKKGRVMRRIISCTMTGVALAICTVFGSPAPPASATDYGVNVTVACQLAGYSSAYLVSSNVYGWRCSPGGASTNIQLWCNYAYPGTSAVYLDYSNPYSWRCRT
jgi:hypothetical protein